MGTTAEAEAEVWVLEGWVWGQVGGRTFWDAVDGRDRPKVRNLCPCVQRVPNDYVTLISQMRKWML